MSFPTDPALVFQVAPSNNRNECNEAIVTIIDGSERRHDISGDNLKYEISRKIQKSCRHFCVPLATSFMILFVLYDHQYLSKRMKFSIVESEINIYFSVARQRFTLSLRIIRALNVNSLLHSREFGWEKRLSQTCSFSHDFLAFFCRSPNWRSCQIRLRRVSGTTIRTMSEYRRSFQVTRP